MKYEGEFLKDARNGKGKEYYNKGELKFEGEYSNNCLWNGKGYDKNKKNVFVIKNGCGFIKEYDDNGVLIFEGDYVNGLRNGNGKEYDKNGKVIYEGEFKNDVRHGKGKLFDNDGKLIYEGVFQNGLREGERRMNFGCTNLLDNLLRGFI